MLEQYKKYFRKLNKSLNRLASYCEADGVKTAETQSYIREMQRICQPCLFVSNKLAPRCSV